MMKKQINPLLLIGLIGTLTIGISFVTDVYRVFWGEHNIWWTPQSMSLPIDETKNNFELYIGGKSLGKHLSEGTLYSVDNNEKQYRIVSKDIGVRLNNWYNIKASVLSNTVISGFAFGIAITLFAIGLIQVFIQKGKSC